MVTFNDRIDADLIFFIFYLIDGIGHEFLYLKKFIVHTKTMLTGETLHERYFIPSTYKLYCQNYVAKIALQIGEVANNDGQNARKNSTENKPI